MLAAMLRDAYTYSTAYFWQTLQYIARLRISFVWLFFRFFWSFVLQSNAFLLKEKEKRKKIRSDMR
jgi:hypothetical protein